MRLPTFVPVSAERAGRSRVGIFAGSLTAGGEVEAGDTVIVSSGFPNDAGVVGVLVIEGAGVKVAVCSATGLGVRVARETGSV